MPEETVKDVLFDMDQWKNRFGEDTRGLIRGLECVFEIFVLSVLYYALWRGEYFDDGVFPNYYFNGKYVLMGVYALLLFLVFKNSDSFKFGQLKGMDILVGQWISILMVNFVTYFQLCLIANHMISPVPMLVLTVLDAVIALILTGIYTRLYHRLYAPHNMILVYGKEAALSIKIKMDTRRDKYKIDNMISVEEGYERICEEVVRYDAVLINDIPAEIRNDILKFCYGNRIRVYVAPKLSDILVRGGRDVSLFDTPLLLVKGTGLSLTERIAKRIFDVVFSTLALIPALPVMLLVAAAIKLEDGGPVFYKQKRLTIHGREFKIYKFRSMVVDAEKKTGAVLATEDDPRITRVGKFIRASRLDELPQIFNILKGDMSIVGPRPERKRFTDEFCQELPEFAYRLKVKSGLTGYAQIYGKYNTNAYDKLRLDLMYIENYSLMLDIKLIMLTIRILFSKDSTEGIDVAQENERLTDELIREIRKERQNRNSGFGPSA